MRRAPRLLKTDILLVLATIVVAYLYLSPPGGIAVNERGEVQGLANSVREFLQGETFWISQLRRINSALYHELSAPQRWAELERKNKQVVYETEQMIEKIYQEQPSLRPSPSQRQAEALRKLADEIEVADELGRLASSHLTRISYLQSVLYAIIRNVPGIGKIGEWRKEGWDNKQIGDYLAPKIEEWTTAGFSDKDINEYLGITTK